MFENHEDRLFLKWYVCVSAIILFGFSFFIFPTTDSYYYWTWSQHLALSYFDGPPMIAYLLWISTHIFGNSFFAIELISVLCIYGSLFLIYKIVSLYSSDNSAFVAVALWMMYPFATTRFIAVSMTLDGLEVFFSLLILYTALKLVESRKNYQIYLLGLWCGLGLLAKYNVILVILGILIYFLYQKDTRIIYFKYQTYLALLISLVIFSPVLIWNYSHHWVSFYYQLNSHKWVGAVGSINAHEKYGFKGVWFYLKSCFFGVLNIYLVLLVYLRYGNKKSNYVTSQQKTDKNKIIMKNCIVFLVWFISVFWLLQSYTKHIGLNYMTILSCFFAMLVAESLVSHKLKTLSKYLIVIFGMISVIMLIDKSRLHNSDLPNYDKYVKSGMIKRGL